MTGASDAHGKGGCGVRLLNDIMDIYASPHCVFLFLLLFTSLLKQEDDWVGTLAGIPVTLLIWLFATYLTFRKREAASELIVAWSKLKVRTTPWAERSRRPAITICDR
jgi:hypothetical protein